MALTRRQREMLDFLRQFIETYGFSPSFEEIAAHFGYRSKGTVHKHLSHLMEKGLIRKAWNRSRSIDLMPEDTATGLVDLPLLGIVAAGSPIEAIEDNEMVSVPADMVGSGEHYVLRVKGDSMIEEQIRDGDYVIVDARPTAENGETVVALIRSEEATVKKFYRENGIVRLEPANPALEPMILPANEVQIRGVVIGVMRKYR